MAAASGRGIAMPDPMVFLLDVDNTLLDNDRAQADYLTEIRRAVNPAAAQRYWQIFQDLVQELGYADYLGALERYRLEDMHDPRLLQVASYLLDYDFANRLYPRALDVVAHLNEYGTVVILTDGDVVFQPRKVSRAGLWEAVAGRVLIFIHKEKELYQVEKRYPAQHYVLVDDKLRILAATKKYWGSRVTTVFARQGHYAADPYVLAEYPPADIAIGHIADLLNYEVPSLQQAAMSRP